MLSVRKIKEKDAKLLYQWANDPQTRENSINVNPIVWNDHLKWFNSKLNSTNGNLYLIISADDKEIGFVRFELIDEWIVSIVVSPEVRGQGFGSKVLAKGLELFDCEVNMNCIAFIKKGNIGSEKIFNKNRFRLIKDESIAKYMRDKK